MEIIVGVAVGLIIGITGLGGGMLCAPLLITVMHFPPARAVGAALVFAAVTKLNAALLYVYRKRVNYVALACLLAGGAPGAAVGALGLHRIDARHFGNLSLGLIGAIVCASAVVSLRRHKQTQPEAPPARGGGLLSAMSFPIGLQVGFSSVGAGALGTVLLFHFTQLSPSTVVGTDLVFGLVIATIAGGVHVAAASGAQEWLLLVQFIAGGVVGASAGSVLSDRVPGRLLRTAVLCWAFFLGLILVVRSLQALL